MPQDSSDAAELAKKVHEVRMPKKASPNGAPAKTPLTNPFEKITPVPVASPQRPSLYVVVPMVTAPPPPPKDPKAAATTATAAYPSYPQNTAAYPVVPVVSTTPPTEAEMDDREAKIRRSKWRKLALPVNPAVRYNTFLHSDISSLSRKLTKLKAAKSDCSWRSFRVRCLKAHSLRCFRFDSFRQVWERHCIADTWLLRTTGWWLKSGDFRPPVTSWCGCSLSLRPE